MSGPSDITDWKKINIPALMEGNRQNNPIYSRSGGPKFYGGHRSGGKVGSASLEGKVLL